MSFLKKLFGGSSSAEEKTAPVVHEGYEIIACPQAEGGQFRLCGKISKEIDGALKEHSLVRADMFSNEEEAVSATLHKAKHLIDEQGEQIFG